MKNDTMIHYDENGMRLTDCCAAHSTFCDGAQCCKVCFEEVEVGEGDGSEYRVQEVAR